MPPPMILDPATLDFTKVVADQDAIRKLNPQRFEMEQLNGIILLDPVQGISVGYKDVKADEFWVRGHMPDYPLMPGVLMCEAVAQLASYYIGTLKLLDGDFVGFGGLENVRFRGQVKPGDRLVLMGKITKAHRKQVTCHAQGFVGSTMVFHADVIGVALKKGG